jgi:hypothetical protein
MTATGGSIDSVSLAGREFAVPTDAEATRHLGGKEAEVEANGNNTVRVILTAVAWMIDGFAIEVDDDNGDQEYVQDIIDAGQLIPIYVTFASGITYQGTGMITGAIGFASKASTMGIACKGEGKLTPQ